ncbi:MAG: site-specific integrase [Atopobiaceae bacterium]|nr:site-specific integrase [Atopobiaceae bacterium]
MLFDNVASAYIEAKRKKVRANTFAGYESALRCHLLPRWNGMELEAIRQEDIQAWVSDMSYGAAGKALKTLRQILRWAIRTYRLRIFCETDGVELPEAPIREERTLSAKELRRCTLAWQGEEWEPVALVQSACGLRPCEAAALTWGDIDLRTGEVHVTKGRHDVGAHTYIWGTKTKKSRRTVVLPRYALERLRELRRSMRPAKSDLLCSLRPSAIYRRMARWFRRHGYDMCAERLRHTWATLAVAANVPIETVAMALGHSGLEMCYTRYLARSTDVFRAAQKKFGEMLLSAS